MEDIRRIKFHSHGSHTGARIFGHLMELVAVRCLQPNGGWFFWKTTHTHTRRPCGLKNEKHVTHMAHTHCAWRAGGFGSISENYIFFN